MSHATDPSFNNALAMNASSVVQQEAMDCADDEVQLISDGAENATLADLSLDVIMHCFTFLPITPYWFTLQKLSTFFRQRFRSAFRCEDLRHLDFFNVYLHLYPYKLGDDMKPLDMEKKIFDVISMLHSTKECVEPQPEKKEQADDAASGNTTTPLDDDSSSSDEDVDYNDYEDSSDEDRMSVSSSSSSTSSDDDESISLHRKKVVPKEKKKKLMNDRILSIRLPCGIDNEHFFTRLLRTLPSLESVTVANSSALSALNWSIKNHFAAHPLRIKEITVIGATNLDAFSDLVQRLDGLERFNVLIGLNALESLREQSARQFRRQIVFNECEIGQSLLSPLQNTVPSVVSIQEPYFEKEKLGEVVRHFAASFRQRVTLPYFLRGSFSNSVSNLILNIIQRVRSFKVKDMQTNNVRIYFLDSQTVSIADTESYQLFIASHQKNGKIDLDDFIVYLRELEHCLRPLAKHYQESNELPSREPLVPITVNMIHDFSSIGLLGTSTTAKALSDLMEYHNIMPFASVLQSLNTYRFVSHMGAQTTFDLFLQGLQHLQIDRVRTELAQALTWIDPSRCISAAWIEWFKDEVNGDLGSPMARKLLVPLAQLSVSYAKGRLLSPRALGRSLEDGRSYYLRDFLQTLRFYGCEFQDAEYLAYTVYDSSIFRMMCAFQRVQERLHTEEFRPVLFSILDRLLFQRSHYTDIYERVKEIVEIVGTENIVNHVFPRHSCTMFHQLLKMNKFKNFESLATHIIVQAGGILLDLRDQTGNSYLHLAARVSTSFLLLLLQCSASLDVNARNVDGDTILHLLCGKNDIGTSLMLVQKFGADPGIYNNNVKLPCELLANVSLIPSALVPDDRPELLAPRMTNGRAISMFGEDDHSYINQNLLERLAGAEQVIEIEIKDSSSEPEDDSSSSSSSSSSDSSSSSSDDSDSSDSDSSSDSSSSSSSDTDSDSDSSDSSSSESDSSDESDNESESEEPPSKRQRLM